MGNCCYALLLAAGELRRMGQLKALLPWHGTTLLEHQVAALQAGGVHQTIVVLGHQAERLQRLAVGKEGVSWAVNPDYLRGKTTSIKAGLDALQQTLLGSGAACRAPTPTGDTEGSPGASLLILNVDQPRNAGTIRHLLQQHCQGNSLITIPTYEGKGGHPIVLDLSLLEELRGIKEETLGVKAVVQRHPKATQRVEVDIPEVLLDLNTPEQYQAALT